MNVDGNKELTTFFKKERSETFTYEDVPQGKQIYMFYGDRPNSSLFLHMGFVSATHPDDTYILPVDALDEQDPIFKYVLVHPSCDQRSFSMSLPLALFCILSHALYQYIRTV